MFISTRIYSVTAACLTFAAGTIAARADILIVSPAAQASVDGNGGNNFPFDIGDSVISSQRYQQVYSASDFAVLNGPALITEILFRPDSLNGKAFSTTLPAIQIDLSTTSAAPDALSTVFANNIGADDTVVYGPGPLALSSAFTGPPGGPKNFDIAINLTHAFLYNPVAGNLLLDVRNVGGGTTAQLDTENLVDASSRVQSNTSGVGSLTGTADTEGLVTEFRLTAVPEPSTWLLLGTCMAGLTYLRRARSSSSTFTRRPLEPMPRNGRRAA